MNGKASPWKVDEGQSLRKAKVREATQNLGGLDPMSKKNVEYCQLELVVGAPNPVC